MFKGLLGYCTGPRWSSSVLVCIILAGCHKTSALNADVRLPGPRITYLFKDVYKNTKKRDFYEETKKGNPKPEGFIGSRWWIPSVLKGSWDLVSKV